MLLKNSKIIVVKIGSSLLVDSNRKIRKKWLLSFAKDIQKLRLKNKKIIIVSSGAIALGCKKMNYKSTNLKLDKSQAIASVGQIELMNLFSQTFSKYKLNISQILLTLDDTEERRRSINAKRTIENLFKLNYIPVVNENDTIATSEIKYGDNDRLASRVAQISNADTLILLSDVDGLFTKNPKLYKWILSSIFSKGELIIDDGAKKALINGKSLLAAGIKKVSGKFNKGDHIKILDTKRKEFARGLSSFSSDEINKIMGRQSNEIEKILGYISKSEVVHKDDMVEI